MSGSIPVLSANRGFRYAHLHGRNQCGSPASSYNHEPLQHVVLSDLVMTDTQPTKGSIEMPSSKPRLMSEVPGLTLDTDRIMQRFDELGVQIKQINERLQKVQTSIEGMERIERSKLRAGSHF